MKLKRIYAFLLMILTLSGCASDVSLSAMENANQATNAVERTQLTHRNQTQIAWNAQNLSSVSLKDEVRSYAAAKKLNTKLINQTSVQSSFQLVKGKSEADQYEVTKPQSSADATEEAFYVQTTLYGVDCYGCNVREDGTGNTATGVLLNPSLGVMQSDGSWLSGLTYDGYYVIAMDASIPFYSIVEISNHGLSGKGFSPDQPIQCIVLDRGGGISGNHVDLYIGSEADINQISYNGSQATARIIRYGR